MNPTKFCKLYIVLAVTFSINGSTARSQESLDVFHDFGGAGDGSRPFSGLYFRFGEETLRHNIHGRPR